MFSLHPQKDCCCPRLTVRGAKPRGLLWVWLWGQGWAHACMCSCMWGSEGNLTCHSFCSFVSRHSLSKKPWLSWNSLCQSGWPQTLRSPSGSASASWVLRLKVCTTMLGLDVILYVCLCACLCVHVYTTWHVCRGQFAGVGSLPSCEMQELKSGHQV